MAAEWREKKRGEEGEAAGSCESNESETPKLREAFAGTGRTWAHGERGGLGGCAGCGRIVARRDRAHGVLKLIPVHEYYSVVEFDEKPMCCGGLV